MSEINKVDARGLSCPQPALLARQALQRAGQGSVEIIVDNTTAKENVTRAARNLGWEVTVDERSEEEIHIIASK